MKCRGEIHSISLGVQLILFPFIGVSKILEPFKNLNGFSFFFSSKCFIPRCGSNEMLPYGVPFDSLSFLYLTSGHFFDFKITLLPWPFLTPPIFYHPEVGSLKDPYGFPLWSLSDLYLPSNFFFEFKILLGLSRFLTPIIFYHPEVTIFSGPLRVTTLISFRLISP